MKHAIVTLSLFYICIITAPAFESKDLLEEVDRFRQFNVEGFSAVYLMTGSDGSQSSMTIAVRFIPNEAVLVHYTAPAREAGRRILVLENSFWLHERGNRQPLRISARQILGGQAAAGDLSRVSFSRMYSLESAQEKEWGQRLYLISKKNSGTNYDRIELDIDKDKRPIRASCMGRSGVLLKTIVYTGYQIIDGKEILKSYRIEDPVNKTHIDIEISNYSTEVPNERSFSVHALRSR